MHFVPDGKEKKLDASVDTLQKKSAPKAEKEIVPMGEDGKLSKKQLAKLAKKDKKATAKADAKGEGDNAGDSKPSSGS